MATSKRKVTSRIAELQNIARQFVIDQTGMQNPSPTFVRDYVLGLQRGLAEESPGETLEGGTATNSSGDRVVKSIEIETYSAQDPPEYNALDIEESSPTITADVTSIDWYDCRGYRSGAPSPQSPPCSDQYTYICRCEMDGLDISQCCHTQGEVIVMNPSDSSGALTSGALPPLSKDTMKKATVVELDSPQDAVVCHADWESLSTHQPHRLLNLQVLEDAGYPAELLNHLPPGYHTTVTGLRRIHEETRSGKGVTGFDVLLKAFLARGGQIRDPIFIDDDGYTKERVVYAEDLVPYVKEGDEGYDAIFWNGIAELRKQTVESGLNDLMAWAAEPLIHE